MEILIVRHGESTGNSEGRLQGTVDSPLTARGRAQATALGDWLKARNVRWDAAYASPLARARETAEILAARTGFPEPVLEPDLHEVAAGSLEGMTRDEILAAHPDYGGRQITDLGDFSEFGGESYADIQARVSAVVARIKARHREAAERVLVVAHGGVNFQLVKSEVCVPVPRVAILAWGNCTACLLRYRDRRGAFLAEVAWHVPLELIDAPSGEGSSGVFR